MIGLYPTKRPTWGSTHKMTIPQDCYINSSFHSLRTVCPPAAKKAGCAFMQWALTFYLGSYSRFTDCNDICLGEDKGFLSACCNYLCFILFKLLTPESPCFLHQQYSSPQILQETICDFLKSSKELTRKLLWKSTFLAGWFFTTY